MSSLEKLIKQFERFPGVGVRQARRFAHHVLTEPEAHRAELASLIATIAQTVITCPSCFTFFTPRGSEEQCAVCADTTRDHSKLLIVERDADVQSIERSGVYDGLYFVLGGTVPLLHSEEITKLRGGALKYTVDTRIQTSGLSEIILAFSINPDGENTARYIRSLLNEHITTYNLVVSELGRGLSTGSELEYADSETIKNALKNRT